MSDISYRFYTRTGDVWEAMLADLAVATTSIDFERYIFCADQIGQRFIDVLKRKAKEGVKIRMLCDMVGSFGFYRSSVVKELEAVGIEVKFFNPISPWRITNITSHFFRDHRKLLIIDNKIGYVGGTGVDQKTAEWRDTEVRFEGEIALEFTRLFEWLWKSTLRQKFIRFKKTTLYVKHFDTLINSPRFRQRYIYRTLVNTMRAATRSVYITTPYFIPDLRILRVLRILAKRGVDVRILVPEHSDYSFIDNSTKSYFSLVLRSGVRIYLYKPNMLHTKSVVIDDEWGTVGTFNFDTLSFRYNFEVNVVSTKQDFVATLKDHFINDLLSSSELTKSAWAERPLVQKIKEFITWPFHGLL